MCYKLLQEKIGKIFHNIGFNSDIFLKTIFRSVLGIQQNLKEGIEISHMPILSTHIHNLTLCQHHLPEGLCVYVCVCVFELRMNVMYHNHPELRVNTLVSFIIWIWTII